MKKIIIIGDSGHSRVVADMVNANSEQHVYAKLDDKFDSVFVEYGIFKGPIHYIATLLKEDAELKVIMGIGSNVIRQKIILDYGLAPEVFCNVIHPSAVISPNVSLGSGVVVMPNAVINVDSVIGNQVIINSSSVVEHDCIVEDYAHISPLAVLTGGVRVGVGSHIGAGASVIPGLNIGKWTTIGAGSTVITDIEDHVTAVGNPARVIRKGEFPNEN